MFNQVVLSAFSLRRARLALASRKPASIPCAEVRLPTCRDLVALPQESAPHYLGLKGYTLNLRLRALSGRV